MLCGGATSYTFLIVVNLGSLQLSSDLEGSKSSQIDKVHKIEMTKSGKRKLGAWFPSASVIKAQDYGENSRISLLLFYHYVTPEKWSEAKKLAAIAWVEKAGERLTQGEGRLAATPPLVPPDLKQGRLN